MKKLHTVIFAVIVFLVCFFAIVSLTYGATAVQIFNGGTGTSTVPGYGQLLIGGHSGEYEYISTSTLIGNNSVSSIFGRTGAVTAQSGDYTTSLIPEGTNLYWTPTRFDNRLSATTSLPSITTLANLSLPAIQLTGFGIPFYSFFHATTTDALSEGASNLYFTASRAISALTGQNISLFANNAGYLTNTTFDNRLSATTSLPNLTTLSGLSLPYSQLTGTPNLSQYLTLSARPLERVVLIYERRL